MNNRRRIYWTWDPQLRFVASKLIMALLVGSALAVAGCYKTAAVGAWEMASSDPPDLVVVAMKDGRKIHFEKARLHGGRLSGTVVRCDMPPGWGPRTDLSVARPGLPPDLAAPEEPWDPLERVCIPNGKFGSVPRHKIASIRERTLEGGKTAAAIIVPTLLAGALITGVAFAASEAGGGDERPDPPPQTSDDPGKSGVGCCPRIYSFDGNGWQLDSGTYAGAFFEAAQRTDHDLLEHLVATQGDYRLRMRNELDETEYVDAFGLLVVDHPLGTRVIPGPRGDLVTIRSAEAPLRATDLRGTDVLERVSRCDGQTWTSDLSDRRAERAADTRDGLLLELPKPPDAREAKLWLTGMNTPWAAHMVNYLLALQGEGLPEFYAELNRSAIARLLLKQFFLRVGRLRVEVRTPSGWSYRGAFEEAGPELAKAQALRIDVADVPGDRLHVRLVSATNFWTVDQVAVAYGADVPLQVQRLVPKVAFSHDGKDITSTLSEIDGDRHTAKEGDFADIIFDAPVGPSVGLRRSLVLASTGYDTLNVVTLPDLEPDEAEAVMASPEAASRRSLELLLAARRLGRLVAPPQ